MTWANPATPDPVSFYRFEKVQDLSSSVGTRLDGRMFGAPWVAGCFAAPEGPNTWRA